MGEGLKSERIHGGDVFSLEGEIADLSVNVNPLRIGKDILKAVRDSLDQMDRYPDPQSRALREAIGSYEGTDPKQVICGNGASELIFDVIRAIRPKNALIPAPTFTEYARAVESAGGKTEYHFLKEEDGFCPDEGILDKAGNDNDLVILCNPNNPTGRLYPYGFLLSLLRKCLENDAFLFVDECFLDFTEDHASLSPLISSHKNLIILKSFTKLYSMPGLRLGYALSGDIQLLKKAALERCPWNVSVPAERAGIAALGMKGHAGRARAYIKKERQRICEALDDLRGSGIWYIEPMANFILFKAENGPDLFKELLDRRILIRDCADFPGLNKGWYRIAVGKKRDNDLFIRAMMEIYR